MVPVGDGLSWVGRRGLDLRRLRKSVGVLATPGPAAIRRGGRCRGGGGMCRSSPRLRATRRVWLSDASRTAASASLSGPAMARMSSWSVLTSATSRRSEEHGSQRWRRGLPAGSLGCQASRPRARGLADPPAWQVPEVGPGRVVSRPGGGGGSSTGHGSCVAPVLRSPDVGGLVSSSDEPGAAGGSCVGSATDAEDVV